ncbi:hypothetical protein B0H17DRAFT_1332495 [Mycena rosella]|uniref:F-box domain-containing protein n=1 Tax=Mycena rosella TaxID=1033263 RepID=A0AAD7GEI2_MYCRO|nr:hypothetical protein B0H17DRAFT_1332495 [Mycena rosella]
MVLTRRAYKAIPRWLPNEIITEIVQAAPRSDQASLCRVSKLFRDLCSPILYRVVDLEANASATDFGDTVLSNAALAGLVRSYSVHFPGAGMAGDALRFSQVLADSSKALVRLEAFLGIANGHWSDAEQHDRLASFLIRHPGLEKLHIQGFPHTLTPSSASVRIPLPRLQHLRCPPRIIPSIVALRLKRVQLYWNDDDLDEVENIFVALKAMTASDVPLICSNNFVQYLYEVVDSVSRNLPHTKTLQLDSYHSPPLNEVIGHLKNCLPRFTGLAFLSVYNSSWDIPTQEEISVLRDACPALEAYRLQRRAWRKVDGMWETYPWTDFDALAGLESWTL